ncbi:MAG: aminopeptidase P family protein [Candidatus Hydrothermarchaeota archaeon]|nr:MAG: aminopeptidase P family protein [Candidatus Hydrothermarchaeota archaeon]
MKRVKEALEKLSEKGLECGVITKPENIYYLTGVFPSAFSVLLLKEDPLLYLSKMDSHIKNIDIETRIVENFKKELKIPFKKVGVEEDSLSFRFYKTYLKGKKIDNLDFLIEMRRKKDNKELKNIKKALNIAEKCLEEVFYMIEEGKTEMEISAYILSFIRKKADIAFMPIVASGRNSSIPHHSPTKRKIKRKDAIIIDLGAKVNYYNSDITRTVSLDPSEKFLELYAIVLEAQKQAINECYAGNEIKKAEEKAREVLKEYGVEEYYLHACGHGIGLEVHEYPKISKNSKETFEEGMVVTVEPGIYKSFGIRIEDMVLVGKKPKILSRLGRVLP